MGRQHSARIPRRAYRWSLLASAALALVVLSGAVEARAQELAAECEYAPNGPSQLVVGAVECLRFDSEMMGGKEPFSYYVPASCAPETGRRCPVLYWLHGLSGDYSTTGTPEGGIGGIGERGQAQAALIRALTSGPAVDPRTHPEPWTLADPALWVPQPPIDMILVAPHALTLPGGYGAAPNKDTGWIDFNPRYAQGGEVPRYDTPPPRAESMILQELIPYVEAHLPTIPGRQGRGLSGISYGGIGTGLIGLHHPDQFSALYQMSGIGFPSTLPCQVDTNDVSIYPPTNPPLYLGSPGITPIVDAYIPLIFVGSYGDGATTDDVYHRYNNSPDIVRNGRALRNGQPVLSLEFYANDAIPYRQEDLLDPLTPLYIFLETLVATVAGPLQESEANRYGVPHRYEMRKGTHSNPYWLPFARSVVESVYASMLHWDGSGNVFPTPDDFDYRTILEEFSIWGWKFSVDRVPQEFLNLTDVTCDGLTLRGSGVVTLTVPPECGTGVDGSRVLSVDLGPSGATNEPGGASSCEFVGNQKSVVLEDLPEPGGALPLAAGIALLFVLRRGRPCPRRPRATR